MYLKITKIW